jgi:hypothetical protein
MDLPSYIDFKQNWIQGLHVIKTHWPFLLNFEIDTVRQIITTKQNETNKQKQWTDARFMFFQNLDSSLAPGSTYAVPEFGSLGTYPALGLFSVSTATGQPLRRFKVCIK